jgi:hypothetical protein
MEAERAGPGSWSELHLSRYQAHQALLALRAGGRLGAD